ncbi:MAG: hypothetical protein M1812_001881 [Candelaria pacifica]|nr:MAG: hypothetical protein M1812_001881 [Candelaria pacifica]
MSDATLFDENFNVNSLNAQKYDRVARISASSVSNDITLTLDVNTELYPCSVGDNLRIVLVTTLALDGAKQTEKGWREASRGEATAADTYDYVCYGKIYRFEEGEGENIKVFVSFGGLLLYMDGPYKKLTPLRIDHVYLMMKK